MSCLQEVYCKDKIGIFYFRSYTCMHSPPPPHPHPHIVCQAIRPRACCEKKMTEIYAESTITKLEHNRADIVWLKKKEMKCQYQQEY